MKAVKICGSRPAANLATAGLGVRCLALAAMVTYLEMNRLTWKCREVEETAMLLQAAAGYMKEAEWEAWVVENVGKKG